ncbi:PadR family transcriptional regulator PadR [Salinibacterium sp. CAN_S4]|uniref:PadR family transcriptional regulator n=1 Tax=Salinibacterium sp. CAN_S4 TaxID=2787727 RepID=UPI0018F01C46
MDSTTSTQLRRGVIGPCILALLAIQPRYGLELVRELDAAGQLLSSQGTVYPLLNRLSEAGLVSSNWQLQDGERPRRYYEITTSGRAELEQFSEDWARFSTSVDDLLRPQRERAGI